MFCSKCGNKLKDTVKFCPKCGTKTDQQSVESGDMPDEADALYIDEETVMAEESGPAGNAESREFVTVARAPKAPSGQEIDSIPELKTHLLALRDAKDTGEALTYAVEAQLQVLDTLNSPSMASGTFDLMIESLHHALELTDDPAQRKDLQKRAAIMANSLVFFMEAKLRYEENKHSQEGKALLEKGCSLLADSASTIMTGGLKAGVKIVGGKLFDNLMQDDSFFSMLWDFINRKERIEKAQSEFNEFLANFIDKLGRHRNLFGKSVALSELVYQYKDKLIARTGYPKPPAPHGMIYSGSIWIKSIFVIAFWCFLAWLPTLFSLYTTQSWSSVVFVLGPTVWILFNLVSLISCAAAASGEKGAYEQALAAYETQTMTREDYYQSIAESFSIYGAEGEVPQTSAHTDIKADEAALRNYARIYKERDALIGRKSWFTTMMLCLCLGFVGAHRFYVGKIGTGIIMILTVETGISLIWALVDLIMIFSGKFTDKEGNIIRI
jgi:tetratricopeptide (TPR) repeat protein